MKPTNGLTVVIEIKDKDGRKIGEKEVATYQGLLAKAHDEGLRRVTTRIVQVPHRDNQDVAIVSATVRTNRGTFTGLGDANPTNVKRTIAGHIIRMAETRAKARALRDAVNIGIVSLEELGELGDDEPDCSHREAPPKRTAPPAATDAAKERRNGSPSPRQGEPMSDAQRRLLIRIAIGRGVPADEAPAWLERELKLPLASLTVAEASRFIDELQAAAPGSPKGERPSRAASAPAGA